MYIYTGLVNSATVIAVLLASGGAIGVTMGTGALDRVIDGCVYKLRDKGISVLVPIMFLLMALLGAFGGGDSLIAVVPIGVMFAQKLRLDPISGASISLLGTLTGFACRPGGSYTAQSIMGITLYSGYNLRLVFLLVTAVVGALYVTWYAKRIEKDPSKSAMGDLSWQADLNSSLEMEEKHITGRDLLITALFIAQFPVAITLNLSLGLGNAVMPAVLIPVAILCGLINGLKTDQIGKLFEKGVANMGFIAFIIGFAGAISLIMQEGKILDTIAYYACMPLGEPLQGLRGHRNLCGGLGTGYLCAVRFRKGSGDDAPDQAHRHPPRPGRSGCGSGLPHRRRLRQHYLPVPRLDDGRTGCGQGPLQQMAQMVPALSGTDAGAALGTALLPGHHRLDRHVTAFHSKKPRRSGAFFCQEPSAILFGILYSCRKIGKGITRAPVCTLHKMEETVGHLL